MSVLTIGQIKAEIRSAMGTRNDADARLAGVINLSQTRLCRLHDFDELRAIISLNTPTISSNPETDKIVSLAMLGRYRKIYSIRLLADNVQSRKLTKILTKEFDQEIPEPEFYSRRTPSRYIMWGKDQMELFPVPDIIYSMRIRFSRWPIVVTDANDGDFLDLENVDDLIIHLSLSYLFLSFGNIEKSNEYYRIYAALAREALGEDEEDFDTHLAGRVGQQGRTMPSLGYNDPFVREMP